jgi:5-methylcytosine-specific restriction enzyme subunit McrC
MLARADAGLLRGYTEAEVTDSQFRGAIDLPKQVRHGWRQPGLFELRVDEFTPDIAWNRIPKAIANRLLSAPGLSPLTRESLSRAVAAFAQVSDTPVSARECDSPALDERTEAYRDLIAWCDLFEAGEILVSLERAFEQYVGRLVREAVGENLRVQETIHLKAVTNLTLPPPSLGGKGEGGVGSSPFSLIPDFVVTRLGSPICVWDTKWKRPDPFAADVHQVIAYAALIGVRACGLIYPGRRFRLDTFQPSTDIPLTIGFLRIPLTDDPVRLNRIIERLRNACRG